MNWLRPTLRGWERAWKELLQRHGATFHVCPKSGETWQYMGTDGDYHEFRHRSLNGVRTLTRITVHVADFDPIEALCTPKDDPVCVAPLAFHTREPN